MSRVYVATETEFGREVVIKVLSPELTADIDIERFRREIQLAARLQHPHIVPLLTAGRLPADGAGPALPYFTMPFVQGQSLRVRLAEGGELPVPEVVRLLRSVASALAYAHAHGVVHRDIKPDNVLVSDGEAVVTDFGVAKAVAAAAGGQRAERGEGAQDPSAGTLTAQDVVIGTPAYMAPEQLIADPALDQRVDVYAFGAMAYELLTGQPPFGGRERSAVFVAHLTEAPPPVSGRRPDVPAALDELVLRCLAKRPDDRPGSAQEIVLALDALFAPGAATPTAAAAPVRPARRRARRALVVGGTLLALGTGGLVARAGRRPLPPAGPVRLAVLPFENLGDSADAYFADGVTDAVRDKLASLQGLEVIAAQSSAQYRATSKSPREIGRELRVNYLLVGRVRWEKRAGEPSRVQVRPELVRVATAVRAWGEPFDAPLTDVFQVQADIAGRVVEALGVALNARTRRALATQPTGSLAAYDAYLQGEAAGQILSDVRALALDSAIAFYERAVALDSTFAPAWAQMARAHSRRFFQGTIEGRAASARAAAERARALAPERPESYLAVGDYYLLVVQDNRRALAEYAAGLAIAPANADLLTGSALAERSLGRWADALRHFAQAQRSDPRSVTTAQRLAQTYLWLRRYDEADSACARALVLAPTNVDVIETRAMIALARGDLAGARAMLRAAPPGVDPDDFVAFVASFWNLYWVLDDAQQRRVLALSPGPFGDERTGWGSVLSAIHQLRGNVGHSRAYADSARIAREAVLLATPEADANARIELGLNLAYMGRKREAIREGERAVAMQSLAADAYSGAYNQHVLARIYLLVGEPEKALDLLEPLLRVPYFLSPGWLRVDPTFAPLRGNPRFERLAAARVP